MKFDTLDKRVGTLECIKDPDGWEDIMLAILTALDSFPDAKAALASKLAEDRQDRSWPELRSYILDNLRPFPAAGERVLEAFEEAGA
jgi:hypothetical protein